MSQRHDAAPRGESRRRRRYDVLKRGMDIALSGVGLLVSAPVQAVTAAVVWKAHGRPVLFRQVRPGMHGEPFELVKFRTMLAPTPERQSDAERLTRVGQILRSTSLDELPTLWNVLKGDMSLVGPRPLLMKYLPLYTARQARRHEVRPGVTGLAQARGRNAISWEEKFELDVQYVEQRSLRLDLQILRETVRAVVKRDGVSQDGHVTMTEFTGIETPADAAHG
ncbi:MAG: sugar transferase [Actinomycetia bacterium]|nr:sugar transferase [Actinomycetes bacterium]